IINDAVNGGIGDEVWFIQLLYRPGAAAPVVIPGARYKVVLEVNASVAGVFRIEMTTTNNVANKFYEVELVAGLNIVEFEFVAFEPELKLTPVLGKYGPATLIFDNFVLYIYE
ncbi:MAG: hypothetical protein Q8M70_08540, partial [bacterium]|nr:hypothetical protein [bacterium]